MDENITEQALSELLDWIKTVKDFTAEQVPLLAEEILRWGAYTAGFNVFVAAVLLVVCFFVFKWSIKTLPIAEQENDTDTASVCYMLSILSGLVSGVSLLVLYFNCKTLIQIWTAPRMYLIEYISGVLT